MLNTLELMAKREIINLQKRESPNMELLIYFNNHGIITVLIILVAFSQ
jgi:hypothetical protein